jgi:hypothetical protein
MVDHVVDFIHFGWSAHGPFTVDRHRGPRADPPAVAGTIDWFDGFI